MGFSQLNNNYKGNDSETFPLFCYGLRGKKKTMLCVRLAKQTFNVKTLPLHWPNDTAPEKTSQFHEGRKKTS